MVAMVDEVYKVDKVDNWTLSKGKFYGQPKVKISHVIKPLNINLINYQPHQPHQLYKPHQPINSSTILPQHRNIKSIESIVLRQDAFFIQ